MIGVCLLPSLYAWFNIAANMDPYGNTKGIKVAVVNNDTGSAKGSIDINAGDKIIENLKKNDQLGWTFTDEDEAIEGVKAGDYYAAIVIPENFSKSLLSILSGKVGKPELDYYINEKKNAIAPKITDTGATTIQNEINDTFSSVASEAIAGLVSSAADRITGDINSADWELARDIAEVRANLQEYQDILKNFSSTAAGADAAIKDTKAALDKVDDTASSSAAALKDTSLLLKKSRKSLGEFSGQCSQSLSEADILLNSITVSASSKLGDFETRVDQVTTVVGSDLDSISDILDENEKLLKELEAIHDQIGSDSQLAQQISQQIERLKAQNASLKELTGSLSSGNAAIKHATATAAETRKELEKITAQNRKTLLGYRSDIEKNLLPQASQSLDDLATLSGRLSATLDGIQPVTAQVRGVLDQLGSSLDTSASALGETGTILESVDGQLEDVINDIHAIKSSKVYRELLSLEGLNSRAIANFMASPVLIESRTLYNVDNYGSGMTPFYTNLAIWVGGLILVSILKQEVDREGLEHKISPTCAYFSRWLMFVDSRSGAGLHRMPGRSAAAGSEVCQSGAFHAGGTDMFLRLCQYNICPCHNAEAHRQGCGRIAYNTADTGIIGYLSYRDDAEVLSGSLPADAVLLRDRCHARKSGRHIRHVLHQGYNDPVCLCRSGTAAGCGDTPAADEPEPYVR